jgi:predicted RNA-binding Zn ribbon-like protein
MAETTIESPIFDESSGNWLCLDFTHTLDDRYRDHPRELLKSYSDLLAWGQYAHVLVDEEAQQLRAEAERQPAEAEAVLQRIITLREALYRMFLAIVEDGAPEDADLAVLNAALAEAMSHACVMPTADGFVWDWANKGKALDVIGWQVARSAADLLTSEHLGDVQACAADDCRWLFLDTSKNHSRRWCDMKSCGNRAKARRHYGRKR